MATRYASPPTRGPVRDLYALLGVAPDASTEEIAAAFRERAKEMHPDRAPHDPVVAEQFKELSRAYATLVRPDSRRRYDARRAARGVAPGAPEPPPARSRPVLGTRGRALAAVVGGIVCVLLGVAISPILLTMETGPDTLGRDVTLWIVVAKLVICGVILVGAGWWRLSTLPRPTSPGSTPARSTPASPAP